MTEQQACTLCGAGGHTAAQCNWNKAIELIKLSMSSINNLLASIRRDGAVDTAVDDADLASSLCHAFLASQQGEQPECGCCGQTGPCDTDCDALQHPEKAEGAPLYSEGICQDGAAILRDGVPVPVAEIIEMLNSSALAQPSPAPELERPEVVAFIHERTGAVATADMVRAMEEGSVPSGYTIGLMAVAQHDRIVGALRDAYDCNTAIMTARTEALGRVTAERDAAQSRLAELEKQEPLAWVDADWIAQVSDPRGAGCTVRRAYGSASADLAPLYRNPVAQVAQVPDCPDRGPWRPITNGRRTVVASDDFTHDVELIVTGDFADGDKHRYAEQLAAWMNAAAPAQGGE